MLTAEQNEELTQVAAGTPMGELLRRYWYPVAFTRELEEFPVKATRLLGEDFAVFKTPRGRYGLLPEACPHRRASPGLRGGRVARAALPVSRLPVRHRRHVPGPAGRAGRDQLPRPGAGQLAPGRGDGRADLGLHRPRPRAAAAAVRRLRDGRRAGHRLDRPAVQLRADHG